MTDTRFSRLGQDFEATVEASLALPSMKGSIWFRDAPPFKVLRWQGGLAVGHFKSGGNLDFYGSWRGRFVSFDAKSTKESKRLPVDGKLIKPEQIEIARECHKLGVPAFFLVCLDSDDFLNARVFCLAWDVLGPVWQAREGGQRGRGVGSIPLATLEASCVEVVRNSQGYLNLAPAFDRLIGGNGA